MPLNTFVFSVERSSENVFVSFGPGGVDSNFPAQLREGKSHYVTSSHRAAGVFKVTTESDVMYMLPLTIEIKLPLPFYFWRVE